MKPLLQAAVDGETVLRNALTGNFKEPTNLTDVHVPAAAYTPSVA